MNHTQIQEAVVAALKSVAPESDPAALAASATLRESLDLDSMDFLNFVVALHTTLHVDIPEADYAKMQSLDAAVSYLDAKLRAS